MLPRLNNKFYIIKKTCFSFKCSMIALSEKYEYIVRKVVQSLITDFNTILTTRICLNVIGLSIIFRFKTNV